MSGDPLADLWQGIRTVLRQPLRSIHALYREAVDTLFRPRHEEIK